MIGVVATLKVQDGKNAEFEATFRELAVKVRANNPGNLLYWLTRSGVDATGCLRSSGIRIHSPPTADHFRELGAKMGPCMAADRTWNCSTQSSRGAWIEQAALESKAASSNLN